MSEESNNLIPFRGHINGRKYVKEQWFSIQGSAGLRSPGGEDMQKKLSLKDPYNIVITGVGGQGNVLASKILSAMLLRKGYQITIGETFGSSQRGGSVMSHIRISRISTWSPQIPEGAADLIIGLEPIETMRVLQKYGSKAVVVLTNTRFVLPVGVIAGELYCPSSDEIQGWITRHSQSAHFINSTDEAVRLGKTIMGNMIIIGAIAGMNLLPIDRVDYEEIILRYFPEDKLYLNLKAFDIGYLMMKEDPQNNC